MNWGGFGDLGNDFTGAFGQWGKMLGLSPNAQTQPTPYNFDTSGFDQAAGMQQGLASMLAAQNYGAGPNMGQDYLNQMTGQNIAGAMHAGAVNAGGSNYANILNGATGAQQQLAGQSGEIRGNQAMQNAGQLAGLYNQFNQSQLAMQQAQQQNAYGYAQLNQKGQLAQAGNFAGLLNSLGSALGMSVGGGSGGGGGAPMSPYGGNNLYNNPYVSSWYGNNGTPPPPA